MSDPAGFVEEFAALAGVDSRYNAERLAAGTLSAVLRHLPAGLAVRVSRRLPRRVSGCLRRRETRRPAPDLDGLLQEVGIYAGTLDPVDAEAYLSAVLVALARTLPASDMESLRSALPAAALLLDRQDSALCLLCAPLLWPVPAGSGRATPSAVEH